MHRVMSPKILYFGTPVVLVSTRNEDGSNNLAPMSSAWWLGQSCMLGMGTRSKTVENLTRERECVLNLPSSDLVHVVDRLALTTGRDPVPDYKLRMGFIHVADKFTHAGLTPVASDIVKPARAAECPVQLEARVHEIREFGGPDAHESAIELRIVRVHLEESILSNEVRHHVDSNKWRPLIMSFCELHGITPRVHDSRLAKVF